MNVEKSHVEIPELFEKALSGKTLSADEQLELEKLKNSSKEHQEMWNELQTLQAEIKKLPFDIQPSELTRARILKAAKQAIEEDKKEKTHWLKPLSLVAAMAVLVLGITYFSNYFSQENQAPKQYSFNFETASEKTPATLSNIEQEDQAPKTAKEPQPTQIARKEKSLNEQKSIASNAYDLLYSNQKEGMRSKRGYPEKPSLEGKLKSEPRVATEDRIDKKGEADSGGTFFANENKNKLKDDTVEAAAPMADLAEPKTSVQPSTAPMSPQIPSPQEKSLVLSGPQASPPKNQKPIGSTSSPIKYDTESKSSHAGGSLSRPETVETNSKEEQPKSREKIMESARKKMKEKKYAEAYQELLKAQKIKDDQEVKKLIQFCKNKLQEINTKASEIPADAQ